MCTLGSLSPFYRTKGPVPSQAEGQACWRFQCEQDQTSHLLTILLEVASGRKKENWPCIWMSLSKWILRVQMHDTTSPWSLPGGKHLILVSTEENSLIITLETIPCQSLPNALITENIHGAWLLHLENKKLIYSQALLALQEVMVLLRTAWWWNLTVPEQD